ncbi:YueH family protein [Bacillus timonensis]|nr:YueH family protein [Bacillus timonensis]
MKIRKAPIVGNQLSHVYIHENKKEEYTLVAIPDIEWSTIIPYVEEKQALSERLLKSFSGKLSDEETENISNKIVQWVKEM